MSSRPAIPTEIRREILYEARHRCAVCCYPLTLEMAHVVPWRETHDHSPENLIALCPNCHTLADTQKWGGDYLKRYKQTPCALARHVMPPMTSDQKILIEAILSVDPDELTPKQKQRLADMLSAFLGLRGSRIGIVSVKPTESSRILLRMSIDAAGRLISSWQAGDPFLFELLAEFGLKEVRVRRIAPGFHAIAYIDGKTVRGSVGDNTLGLLKPGYEDSFAVYVDGMGNEFSNFKRAPYAQVRYAVSRTEIAGVARWELPFDPIQPQIRAQFALLNEKGRRIQTSPMRQVDATRAGQIKFKIPMAKYMRRRVADVVATIALTR